MHVDYIVEYKLMLY